MMHFDDKHDTPGLDANLHAESPAQLLRPGARQEQIFNAQGITADYVVAFAFAALHGKQFVRDETPKTAVDFHPRISLYLNSSDSLHNLYSIPDIEGASVLTIAGSGDFALAFLDRGARVVEVVDSSLPACFFSELKLRAPEVLTFQEYWKMFGGIYNHLNAQVGQPVQQPLFDHELYEKVRPLVSTQTAIYFDVTMKTGFELLHTLRGIVGSDGNDRAFQSTTNDRVIRYRSMKTGSGETRYDARKARYPYLHSAERYEALRNVLQKGNCNIRLQKIEDSAADLATYDYVYSSNAGFIGAPRFAAELVKSGGKRVGFTYQDEYLILWLKTHGGFSPLVKAQRHAFDEHFDCGHYFELAPRDHRVN